MFLCDACNQPVSFAWIGSICSRVALEKWGWHHCSPVSPSLFRSVLLLDSPFAAGCVMTIIPTSSHNGLHCGHFLFHQSSVTLNWIERNQTALLPVPIFSCVVSPFESRLAGSLHSNNESRNCSGELLLPCLSTGSLLLEGAFFCTKCYKCFIPETNSALYFNFPADERESYPVEHYFLPLSLLVVTHFLPSL